MTDKTDYVKQSSAFTFPGGTNPPTEKIRKYRERVSELRMCVAEEGDTLNRESEDDFWRFVLKEPGFRMGGLVVTDEGNLRMVWQDNEETHLGLQFLGSGEVVRDL